MPEAWAQRTASIPRLLSGTTADRRGTVVPGDVVQEIDGKAVKSTSDLLGRLGSYRPGDTVTLTVWRDEKTRKVRVRLGAPPE